VADIHIHGVDEDTDHEHATHAHGTADHSLVFSTWNWTTAEPISLTQIRKVSKDLPTSIYRAKGILNLADTPDRKAILQVVGNRIKVTISEAWGEETPLTQIVVIGAYGKINAELLQEKFESTIQANLTVIDKVAGSVWEWFRGDN
jgi:G3E family GTPase